MKKAPPVRPGMQIRLEVHDLGLGGEGVGRYEGLTVFVPGGVPGDVLEADVTEVKARHARARLTRVVHASPDRVAPPCPVVDRCGGCPLQHVAYPAQLALKRRQVETALARHGLADVPVHPVLGMDDPWRYRHKIQFPLGRHEGQVVAGFFAAGSHRLVDLDGCPVQHPLGDAVMAAVRTLAAAHGVPVYDEATHEGVLRHVLVRVGRGTGEAMAVLVTNGPDFPSGEAFAQALRGRVPGLTGVVQNVNAERTNVVLGRESRVLAGKGTVTDTLTDSLGDLRFTLSPPSFFQVNPAQAERLYDVALTQAALTGTERVVDVYCGIGTLSLFLARRAREVVGVEVVAAAVADASANAAANGAGNARFVSGDAAAVLPRLAEEGYRADVVVVDPPRRGCDEAVLRAMAGVRASRLVYVSCNPVSLARDLAVLGGLGYRTAEVQPVDLFPHTAHVECSACLVPSR